MSWNDHSSQSLCPPVNIGASPMVLVSTSSADIFGTAAICCRVSSKALSLSAPDASRAHPHQLSSVLRSSLKFKCCLVHSSTPRAPLPRLSLWLRAPLPWRQKLCTVSLDTNCSSNTNSRDSTAHHHSSSPLPNRSRQESYAARCTENEPCFSRDTTEGFGPVSVCYTLRAKVPTEGTEIPRWAGSPINLFDVQQLAQRYQTFPIQMFRRQVCGIDCAANLFNPELPLLLLLLQLKVLRFHVFDCTTPTAESQSTRCCSVRPDSCLCSMSKFSYRIR